MRPRGLYGSGGRRPGTESSQPPSAAAMPFCSPSGSPCQARPPSTPASPQGPNRSPLTLLPWQGHSWSQVQSTPPLSCPVVPFGVPGARRDSSAGGISLTSGLPSACPVRGIPSITPSSHCVGSRGVPRAARPPPPVTANPPFCPEPEVSPARSVGARVLPDTDLLSVCCCQNSSVAFEASSATFGPGALFCGGRWVLRIRGAGYATGLGAALAGL